MSAKRGGRPRKQSILEARQEAFRPDSVGKSGRPSRHMPGSNNPRKSYPR